MGVNVDNYIITREKDVVQTMQKIDLGARGILFVVDELQRLVGCVTDGDIRRWLIKTADLTGKVEDFMFRNPVYVHSIREDEMIQFMDERCISALPIVDEEHHIVDICFRTKKKQSGSSEHKGLEDVPVVIMAGGKGTRLYPYTKILPKPLIPIGGVPIIERIINHFTEYSAKKFFITVNYKKAMLRSYFEDLNPEYEVCFVEEEKPLGTGGSLKLITEKFMKPFVVTNSDILIETDISLIYKQHIESGNKITIVSSLKNFEVPYGVLKIKEGGLISGMEEKPRLSYFINTGMYIVDPDMINLIPEDTFFHMTDLVDKAMEEGYQVGMYPISEDTFLDMGEFEEMKRMEEKLGIDS